MAEILTSEPSSVTAGDTIRWRKSLSDYPATAWTLKYRLINAAGKIDITAGANGSDYLIDVPAVTSAAWMAGDYDWQSYVEKGAERYTVSVGRIVIAPNLAAQPGGYDNRSYARKVLDAIEAALMGRASKSQLETEVAGRRIKYIPFSDLLALRDKFRAEVRSEDIAEKLANIGGSSGKVMVRI